MNKSIFFLLSLTTFLLSFNPFRCFETSQQINPLIGDVSFFNKFGYLPDGTTDEDLRIKTHLEYIENLLRYRDVSHMPTMLQKKRNHILDLLHDYWSAGIFPRNYDYADLRKPCFIDKEERICAVGYLVEQTAGRVVAEQINNKHKYKEIFQLKDIIVDEWISSSGLTKEECAMIQPAYGPPPVLSYNYISPANGITSSLFTGLNLSLNTINGIQIAKRENKKTVPIIGLITGAGQVIFGAVTFPEEDLPSIGHRGTNESLKALCLLNIGFGTSTMILSIWNLVVNTKPKEKKVAWNIYGYQTRRKEIGLAFSLTKKF